MKRLLKWQNEEIWCIAILHTAIHTQAILYGAQSFSLEDLFTRIARCKMRGVRVALSIDGTKKSGKLNCPLPIPEGLF